MSRKKKGGGRYYSRVSKRWVSKATYNRWKGTGKVVDVRRVKARERVVRREQLTRVTARDAEIARLAAVLAEHQHLSKRKAKAKATRITDARAEVDKLARAEQRRQTREAAKRSKTRRVVEYEAKIAYTRRRDQRKGQGHTSALINFRFRWEGYGDPPADQVVREYAFQSMRVEGYAVGREAQALGFDWAAMDWLNIKGTRTWANTDESELTGHGEQQDLTAFAMVVETVGRNGIEIGVVRGEEGDDDNGE